MSASKEAAPTSTSEVSVGSSKAEKDVEVTISPRKAKAASSSTTAHASPAEKSPNSPTKRSSKTKQVKKQSPSEVPESPPIKKLKPKKTAEKPTPEEVPTSNSDNPEVPKVVKPKRKSDSAKPSSAGPPIRSETTGHSQDEKENRPNSAARVNRKRLAQLVAATAAGNALQIIASATDDEVQAYFPHMARAGLQPGCSVLMPESDALGAALAGPSAKDDTDDGEESRDEAVMKDETKSTDCRKAKDRSPYGVRGDDERQPDDGSKSAPQSGAVEGGRMTYGDLRDAAFAGALVGSSEVIEECLRKGADLSLCDLNGRNIFHFLSVAGRGPLFKRIMKRVERQFAKNLLGKSQGKLIRPIDLLNGKDQKGWTPLLIAVCRSNLEVMEEMISFKDLNVDETMLHTCPPSQGLEKTESAAIHLAAIQANQAMVELLLKHSVPMDKPDGAGRNIFHYIAAHESDSRALICFQSLSKHPLFKPHMLRTRDHHGRSPLFIAVAWGNVGLTSAMMNTLSTEKTWSAEEELLSQDIWQLAPLHVANLRRHFDVISQIARDWSSCRNPERDAPTLTIALRRCAGEVQSRPENVAENDDGASPVRILSELVNRDDGRSLNRWMFHDLSVIERSAFGAIKAALTGGQTGRLASETELDGQLARAIRRAGVEMCLRCLEETLKADRTAASAVPKKSPILSFLQHLRAGLSEDLNEVDSQSAWRFIRQGTAPELRTARTDSSCHGDFTARISPDRGVPGTRTAPRAQVSRAPPPPPAGRFAQPVVRNTTIQRQAKAPESISPRISPTRISPTTHAFPVPQFAASTSMSKAHPPRSMKPSPNRGPTTQGLMKKKENEHQVDQEQELSESPSVENCLAPDEQTLSSLEGED